MNYLKVYYDLMKSRQRMSRNCYLEKHHIVPKSIFGKGYMDESSLKDVEDKNNIVSLTGREHFVAHWLLHRAFPGVRNFSAAFHAMASMTNKYHKRYTPSSRAIEEARIANADTMKLPVAMYSSEGVLIKTFDTTESAANEVGSSVHNISAACNVENNVNNIKGFQWRRYDKIPLSSIEPYINQNSENSLSVHEYDLKGNYIRSYNSIREAASKGVNRSSLKLEFRNKPIFSKNNWYIVSSSEPEISIKIKKTNTQKRKVLQINPLNGEIIKIWNSTREPQRILGVSNVNSVCNGKRKTMGGFIWKYADENLILNLNDHKPKLTKAKEIEVILNGVSFGIFMSLRKAEEKTGISRIKLSEAMKLGKKGKNGIQVLKK
ncbi:MAG: NUMOD1 domain-containing DNA-binding protein [Flavobacterium sp.]|uniref:NUMOD1 domain-containing DNA-binding protein n=1 Tax=Flavobacterium sp. TaxID=239 RepID=UPI002B4AA5A9|nr:NUMOD1 domain-containing DNA-binding protein [Flavobacterium sp.]WRH73430.1 MAG: NUMOD1 domain-containing DNA-binding protein [Flavobacterium sp.]